MSFFWPRTQQLVGTHGKMYFSFFRLAREIQLYKGAEKRKRWPCLSLPTFPCWLLSKILQIRSLEYKTFYHSTLVLCHLCKTGKIKDKKTQDSQVIRSFYVHHPVSGFYKTGITSNVFAISKMFSYLQHTEKKTEAAVNHPSILSPNCLLAVQTWSTNWRTALHNFIYLPPPPWSHHYLPVLPNNYLP